MTEQQINQAFEGRWRIYGNYGKINQNRATMSYDEFFDYIKGMCRDFFKAGILLGQSDLQPKVIVRTPLDRRAEDFCRSLNTTENNQKYGQQMLKDFYDYWTEPNPSNTKMRFELQKTWDLNRRLARWARNNFNRYDIQQPTIDKQRTDKLASILTE